MDLQQAFRMKYLEKDKVSHLLLTYHVTDLHTRVVAMKKVTVDS